METEETFELLVCMPSIVVGIWLTARCLDNLRSILAWLLGAPHRWLARHSARRRITVQLRAIVEAHARERHGDGIWRLDRPLREGIFYDTVPPPEPAAFLLRAEPGERHVR